MHVYVRLIFALFLGEDLNNKARTKFQNEQLREWSEQQMKERRQADHNQKTADRLYDLKMRELDQRACELAKAEEDCRRAINVAVKDYNNALVSVLYNCGLVNYNHALVSFEFLSLKNLDYNHAIVSFDYMYNYLSL